MYHGYWGLAKSPFENIPAPEFFYGSRTHHTALLKLRYLISHCSGAGLVVGGVGVGKTSLARLVECEHSAKQGPVIPVVFPQFGPAELLAYITTKLGTGDEDLIDAKTGLDWIVRELEARLTRLTSEGRHTVFFIDDAHLIEDQQVLRSLQLLLNFQQRPGIEFSLILLGEPSLLAHISRMGALDERMSVKSVLEPFTRSETAEYVMHRLNVAGCQRTIFDDSAVDRLFELSSGHPRRINRLCDVALLVGFADELARITSVEIDAVSQELSGVSAAAA
jgi:general secretion pathway protein A